MIGLLGFGKSNQILYKFLKGKKLFVSEISSLPKKWKKIFIDDGTEFEENGHSEKLLKCDLIIKSPGAKRNLPILKAAEKKGIEIINEMEYTYRVLRTLHMVPKIVVITGTNGKTTTTSLIGEMLKQNYEVFVGGNIGNPFCEILNVPKKPQIAVLEISSFQALDLKDFKIDALAILNIKQDHIDWHGSFENYKNAKLKLLKHCRDDGVVILNMDDEILRNVNYNGNLMYFSLNNEKADFYMDVSNKKVYFHSNFLFKMPDVLKYNHNYYNALAAIAVSKNFGIQDSLILKILKNFEPEEHRLEEFFEFKGIKFINDSKATNSSATIAAINSFPEKRIILILSGKEKNEDFSELIEIIKNRVKHTVLVGEMVETLKGYFNSENIAHSIESTFYNAVEKAIKVASEGDYILLSPAGASFDMFDDYKHRGKTFKKIVFDILKGNGHSQLPTAHRSGGL